MGLARLLQPEKDVAGARRVLEPVVAAIDEGHDLEDLRDARSVLRALETEV